MVPVLAGRSQEIGVLVAAIDELQSGRGGLVHVTGESGIGKSSLLDVAERLAVVRAMSVLSTTADETDRIRPWAIATDLLRSGHGLHPSQALDSAADPAAPLLAALEQAASTAPLVVIADDLQWADRPSLDLLAILARRAVELPVLLLTAARPLPAHTGHRRIEELADRLGRRLRLSPLGPDELDALLADRLGHPPSDRMRQLARRAGGNPFLATAVCDSMARVGPGDGTAAERGALTGRRHGPRKTFGLEDDLGERLLDRALLGIDDPAADLLVRTAAVLPPGFDVDELVAVTGRPIHEVVATVLALVRSGILVDTGQGLDFRHALLRDLIADSTPPSVARVLRRSALGVLFASDRTSERAAVCLLAGFDATDPDDAARALDLGRRLTVRSPAACADLLGLAVQTIRPDHPERWPAISDLGWAMIADGRAAEVPETMAALAAGTTGQPPIEISRLEGVALSMSGRIDDVMARYADYDVERIEDEFDTDDPNVIDAVAELGAGLISTGQLHRGLDLLAWVEGSPTPASPARIASIEAARATANGVSGNFEASIDHARASLRAIAASPQAVVTPSGPVLSIALGQDLLGDGASALATLRDTRIPGLVPRWTQPLFQCAGCIVRYRSGDWDDALAEAEAGLLAADEVGLRFGIYWPFATSALIHLARNEVDDADRWLARADAVGGSFPIGTEWLTFARAMAAAAHGDIEGAAATLSLVCAVVVDVDAIALLLGFGPETTRLAIATGRDAELSRLVDATEMMTTRTASPVARAVADWVAGLAFDDGGKVAAAAELMAAVGRRPDTARASHDAAVIHLRHGRLEEARALAATAFHGYDELAAEAWHARLRSDMRAGGLPMRPRRAPPRATSGWESLTDTESRIVAMVGEGRTNSEIADRLFVSRRTVESHLGRVYAKVDLASRTQLAAAVVGREQRQ